MSSGETDNNNSQSQFREQKSEVDVEQVVTFFEDGPVEESETCHVPPTKEYLADVNDALRNDVVGFLSRPVVITTFDWLSSTNPNGQVRAFTLPPTYFSHPMVSQKFAGFRYLRCDFVVRVQVNAQPFNAGRLIVWFQPIASQLLSVNPGDADTPDTSTEHLGGVTGYRHVDLDLSASTSVEFRIPFFGPLSHYDLVYGAGIAGMVRIYVYSNLTGSTDVDGTVWCHAENIDIHMPTGQPLHEYVADIQSGFPRGSVVDGVYKRNPINTERKSAKMGDVETIAKAAGRLAKKGEGIPEIGPFASAVSWVSDAVAGMAHWFGWSRPLDPDFPKLMQPSYYRHMANYNGDSKAKVLAMDSRNSNAVPLQCTGCVEDEMSFAHIFSRPVFLDRFTLDITQPVGSYIWRWPVDPTACVKHIDTIAPGPAQIQYVVSDSTYLSYISNMFQFWRGTLRYHFKIVKTVFHSGRIRVLYVPGAETAAPATGLDPDKCYSKVYDIRDTIEFDFEIPYSYAVPWIEINKTINTLVPTAKTYSLVTGWIYVEVLNTLRSPATVAANHIDIIVETSAGDDFQLGYPHMPQALNLNISQPPDPNYGMMLYAGSHTWPTHPPTDVPDVGEVVEAQVQSGVMPFFEGRKMQKFTPNQLGPGEAISGLRQLLKRYMAFATPVMLTTGNNHRIDPYANYIVNFAPAHTGARVAFVDPFTYVAQLYRFYSGNMRLLIDVHTHENPGTVPGGKQYFTIVEGPVDHSHLPQLSSVPWYTTFNPGSPDKFNMDAKPMVIHYPATEGSIELEVPFYRTYPVELTNVGYPRFCNNAINANRFPHRAGTAVDRFSLGSDNDFIAFRSIGEDFSFSYLIGPPQLAYFLSGDST